MKNDFVKNDRDKQKNNIAKTKHRKLETEQQDQAQLI